MTLLRLRLLGGFDAQLASGPDVGIVSKKARLLLAYLALSPGCRQPREKLAGLLWGGTTDEQSRASLRQTIASLRRSLDGRAASVLVITGPTVGLAVAGVSIDVVKFENLVADGRPAALERAAAVYGGDLLEGIATSEPAMEEWLLTERERLRELAVEALRRLLAHQSWMGSVEQAMRTAGRLVAIDPLEEGAHRALMGLYVRQGRRAAAVRQYRICERMLKRDLGAEPEAETVHLYNAIVSSRAAAGPAPSEPSHRRTRQAAPMKLPDTMLAGREAAMESLSGCLDRAAAGRRQIVVITGEAGVGRTRLVEWLAAEATRRGGRVLAGQGNETQRAVPFGLLVELLRFHVVHNTAAAAVLDAECRVQLSSLFPELARTGAPPAPLATSTTRLFGAVTQLLEQTAAERPLTLVAEDVHWADDASLALVVFVARHLRDCPVLLVLTACDELMTAVHRRMLARMEQDDGATPVPLLPLGRAALADLVTALPPDGVDARSLERRIEQVWQLSEGNPLVAMETMRMMPSASGDAMVVSRRVRDMVMRRLELLSEGARGLLEAAGVAGMPVAFTAAREAAALPAREAARALEELVRRRLVDAQGDVINVRHERVRRVIAESVVAPRRDDLRMAMSRAQGAHAAARSTAV
ncbi:MAG: AAA family ATPase [Candidatus Rokuibacteriota bacterium]